MKANPQPYIEAARILLQSSKRLHALSFGQERIVPLLDACSIVVMRVQLGPNRLPIIGFIGCTGTGKSTLFNSLVGSAVSSTSWHAHNTGGPVLVADTRFHQALASTHTSLFPSLQHRPVYVDPPQTQHQNPMTGSPSELIYCIVKHPLHAVFLDLPDINTTRAHAEHRISLQLLPWLDIAVFLTDDETVYHRDYEEPVSLSKTLQQYRVCALVNRGNDRVDLDHHDLMSVRDFFQVERLFVLPDLNGKPGYTREPAFVDLKNGLMNRPVQNDLSPMLYRIADFADSLMQENQKRNELLADTAKELEQSIDSCLSKPVHIPLNTLLQDDVLHVLHHLGLKRFAVSNILRFFKSTFTTGALRRSFTLAFGEQRSDTLDAMLKFDSEKLIQAAAAFLSDYGEEIAQTLRKSKHSTTLFQTAPEFRELTQPLSTIADQPDFQRSISKVLRDFEQECRNLLQSDSIKRSIKNDPLVAVSVVVMLITDLVTIPGIGSFLLVPSVFSLLPMGQFEKAKRRFQRNIRDQIQTELLQIQTEFERKKIHFTLDPAEQTWKALQTCTALKEKPHAH